MPSAPIMRELRETAAVSAPHGNHPHHVAMYRRIATAFVLLTALVLGLVAYVVLARAEVVVLSEQQPAEAEFILDVSEKPNGAEVPGVVLEMTDTVEQTFPASSVVKIDAHAEGRVKIYSTLGRAQTLIATTRLLTPDGILFRIKNDVTIPSLGTSEVDVFADIAGSSGDVGNVATFTIPGLNAENQRFFKVSTVTPIAGGTKEVRMVTKKDVDAAEAVLIQKMETSMKDELRTKALAQNANATGEFLSVDVLSRDNSAAIGEEKADFTLKLRAKGVGTFYEPAAFDLAVANQLNERLPAGRALHAVDKEALGVKLEKVDVVGGRANLRVTAKATTVLSAEEPALSTEKLVGVSVDAARQYLEAIEGVASASVKVSPFWVKRLPNVPEHIHVEVR